MNRDQYIQMRRTGQYDLGWFYQYFLENKDKNRVTPSFEVFQQAFNMYFQFNGPFILEYMDKKMEVSKIENKQGQLIYIN
tara:strand:- start:1198 stop:1437 length:240 start_codon:yes stop_codon:yes gene_type:complete